LSTNKTYNESINPDIEKETNRFLKKFNGTKHNVTLFCPEQLSDYPIKGNVISFQSHGMFPSCDNRYYIVLDNYLNHKDIYNIAEIDLEGNKTGLITQVIVHFNDGFNKCLYKMADNIDQLS
jgi:hypothetical protein